MEQKNNPAFLLDVLVLFQHLLRHTHTEADLVCIIATLYCSLDMIPFII